MNISIEKNIFITAVHTVTRFAERRSATLPILSSVLILVGDAGIKMRATNLETGIDLLVSGTHTTDGVVAIPATILQQLANSLSREGMVTIEQRGDSISLITGTNKSLLRVLSYEDFPSIPFPEHPKHSLILSGVSLRGLLSSLAGCASTSTIRPELASIYCSIEGGVLTMVATDSFRLCEKKVPLQNRGAQGLFLLPAKNALDIAQALPDEDITISFDEHQCAFSWSTGTIVSRLTNSTYPDYRQIIPREKVVEATILCRDFEQALKRTAIFSDTFQKITLHFDPKRKQFSLTAKNASIGESSETLAAQLSGTELSISFNHRFLSSIFQLTQAESLSVTAAGIGRPLIIRGVGDNSLLYLVSPMNQ